MALEVPVASQASTGNWLIGFTTGAANALSVAALVAGKSLTYSFTPDGFNWTITEESVDDPRLTLAVTLSQPGTSKEVLELKYVASTDANSAQVALPQGATGKLTVRRAIGNATAWTIGQKVDVITFIAGRQRPDAPTANGIDTVSQTLYITAPTVVAGTLVA